jgi:hypothetical protein
VPQLQLGIAAGEDGKMEIHALQHQSSAFELVADGPAEASSVDEAGAERQFTLRAEAGTTYEVVVDLGTLADAELSLVGMDGLTELAASGSGGAGVGVPNRWDVLRVGVGCGGGDGEFRAGGSKQHGRG